MGFFSTSGQHALSTRPMPSRDSSAPSRAPSGVTRVLQKPLQPERLLSTVREYCAL